MQYLRDSRVKVPPKQPVLFKRMDVEYAKRTIYQCSELRELLNEFQIK